MPPGRPRCSREISRLSRALLNGIPDVTDGAHLNGAAIPQLNHAIGWVQTADVQVLITAGIVLDVLGRHPGPLDRPGSQIGMGLVFAQHDIVPAHTSFAGRSIGTRRVAWSLRGSAVSRPAARVMLP